MFQKVHFQLAVLCAGITSFILLAMSCGYLYISEQGLKKSSFISFQNDMNTIISNLEQQTVITHEWLSKMEDNGKYFICMVDNGIPFLYNERNSEEQKALFDAAWEYFDSHFEIVSTTSTNHIWHHEFPFSYKKIDYFSCIAISEHNQNIFQVLILAPLHNLEHQIHFQRILFFTLDVLALFILSLFSWYFTKHLLRPLQENQEKQNQFIASASHELRTPLAVILSCISALEKSSGEERTHFLDAIYSEGERMSHLVDDLLLLTSTDSHGQTIQKSPVELDTLFLNTFETFEALAKQESIHLQIELPDEPLPPCPCDKTRIQQVLGILIHNAISYTQKGGKVRLTLSFSPHNHIFQLFVIDNGIGIPDELKTQVFERFFRADLSRNKKDHFGLGLSIAAKIVKAHHGKIYVKDTPGGGSTFVVELPLLYLN